MVRKSSFGSCHPFILGQVKQQLGRHVRSMLPVDDGYASPGSMVYLDSKLSRTLEATLVTYMPGDAWGKVLKVNSRELYDEHAGDYDSHCGEWNGQLRALGQLEVKFSPFPPFDIWVGIESVAGETLRRYHE